MMEILSMFWIVIVFWLLIECISSRLSKSRKDQEASGALNHDNR